MSEEYERIIDYWIGNAASSAEALKRRNRLWFTPDEKVDREIESRFGELLVRSAQAPNETWKSDPRGRLGLIILMDQFPRNIYRGTAKAFAFDDKALDLCQSGIDTGLNGPLDCIERLFFYLPLQHAEAPAPQQRSVALTEQLVVACPREQRDFFNEALKYAREHRDLIDRFGRFPHRNRVLGRTSTPDETAFLEGGGSTFGQ